MSTQVERNLATISSIYRAFGAGDVAGILRHIHDDVEWEFGYPHNADIPWLRSGRGHAQVQGFLGELRAFEIRRFEVLSLMAAEVWVVALVSIALHHAATGITIDEPCEPHVWRCDDAGRVVAMRHAADTRSHLRVAAAPGGSPRNR